MSPALLLVVIDALKDPNQDAAELAGHIAANALSLDTKTKAKAADNLKACIKRGVGGDSIVQVLKALAACAHFDFLEHASAHPHDTNSDYYFKVASVFEEQLQTEQGEGFTEKQLSPLMSILMQHWPCQDEASDLVVNSWPMSCQNVQDQGQNKQDIQHIPQPLSIKDSISGILHRRIQRMWGNYYDVPIGVPPMSAALAVQLGFAGMQDCIPCLSYMGINSLRVLRNWHERNLINTCAYMDAHGGP